MNAKDILLVAFDKAGLNDPDFWAKHVKRYHPDGIDKNSSCKYFGRVSNQSRNKNEGQSIYNQGQKLSFPEAQRIFTEKYDGICVKYKTRQDLDDVFLDKQIKDAIIKYTEPTDDEDFKETIISAVEVLEDIKQRFPKFSLYYPFIVPARMKRIKGMGGALSSVDRLETYDAYIAISKQDSIPFTGFCFGHDDGRYFSDRLRHEIGHFLTTPQVLRRFLEITKEMKKQVGEDSFYDMIEQEVSQGATINEFEGIAEIFSFVSSPEYKSGAIDKRLENFVRKNMLGEYET